MPAKKKRGKKKSKLPPASLYLNGFTVHAVNPNSLPADPHKVTPSLPNPGGMGPCGFDVNCNCKGFTSTAGSAPVSSQMWNSAVCVCKHGQMYHSKKKKKKKKKKSKK